MQIAHYLAPYKVADHATLEVGLRADPLHYKRLHLRSTGTLTNSEVEKILREFQASRDTIELALEFIGAVATRLVETALKLENIKSLTFVCKALDVTVATELLPKFAHSANRSHCLRLFCTARTEAHEQSQTLEAISTLVANDAALLYLEIYNLKLYGEEFEAALGKNKAKVLVLSDYTIDQKGALRIAAKLKSSNRLLALRLSYSSLGNAAVVALAESLKVNHSLRKVSLESVEMTSEGGQALARMLEQNSTLREIYLSDDLIGDEGGIAFAQALQVNTSLRILYIQFAGLGDESGRMLSACLTKNRGLTQMYLQGNVFNTDIDGLLVAAARRNPMMDVLQLRMSNLLEKKPSYKL